MSVDLYASEIDSKEYGKLYLDISLNGNLRIVSINSTHSGRSSFFLPPTSEGLKEAKSLIGALQEWVRHTKELDR
jgi:hypothetical protein